MEWISIILYTVICVTSVYLPVSTTELYLLCIYGVLYLLPTWPCLLDVIFVWSGKTPIKYFHLNLCTTKQRTKNMRIKDRKSVTSSPLAVSFLWVSASLRAEPSTPSSWKTTTHLFSVVPTCKILSIFEHPVILAGLFWPSQDCLSQSQWWYKFLLPPLPQTECSPDGEHWQWCSAISEVRHRKNSWKHALRGTEI